MKYIDVCRMIKQAVLQKQAEDRIEPSGDGGTINYGDKKLDEYNPNFPIRPDESAGLGSWWANGVSKDTGLNPGSYMQRLEANNKRNSFIYDSPLRLMRERTPIGNPKGWDDITQQDEANIGRFRSKYRAATLFPYGTAPNNAFYNLFEKLRWLNRREYDDTGTIDYTQDWKTKWPGVYESIKPYYDKLSPDQQKDVDTWAPTSYNNTGRKKIYG